MITFAYPKLLYLLLLIPLVAILFALARKARRDKLARYGHLQVLEPLMPDVSKYMPYVKLSLSLVIIALLVVVLARPRVEEPNAEETGEEVVEQGIEVMLCLDVSNSMMASSTDDDRGVARLNRAKHLLEKLVDRLRNDKVGLIVFAGEAYTQLPITTDYISAKMFLDNISPDAVTTQGTAIGAALEMAMNSFTPDDEIGKAVIVITDGENFEDDAVKIAETAAKTGIQVDVVGLGTARGAKIPVGNGQYMINPATGEEVVTHLDDETAEAIAKAGDGIYVNGGTPSALSDLASQLDKLKKGEFKRKAASPSSEQFPVVAFLALIFLLINAITVTRKISWLKKYTFFSGEKGGKQS